MYYFRNVYAARSGITALLDAACLLIAFALTWGLFRPPVSGVAYAASGIASAIVICAVLFFNDAYQPATIGDSRRTTTAILSTMGLAFAAAVAFYFGVTIEKGVSPALASIGGIFFPLLFSERIVLRLLMGSKLFTSKVVIIGATDLGARIASHLKERSDAGIRLVGFLSDDAALHDHGAKFGEFPIIGRVHQLEKILADRKVDYVVVASKNRHEHFPETTLIKAKMTGVRVESGVSFMERLAGLLFMRDLHMSYLIFGDDLSRNWLYEKAQRVIDLVLGSLLLAIALPALGLAALAIKLDSPGPVLFRQERLGRGDKPFLMNKLRSMKLDAESESGPVMTSDDDDRITRVGYFLRRTRLDELPQLWNVLRGDMSLVGPRAERQAFVDVLTDAYRYYAYRTIVRPGITGWAQTRYGYVNNVEAYEDKLALDLYYLKHRSLLLDLTILAQTVKTVLHFRGQ
jgi:exopolysaccharide biosynthesis polyprenyl glycosylphosphotransferase